MAGSQKVFLRIVGLMGDGPDADEMPDRINVTGSGRLVPTIAVDSADVALGEDGLYELRLMESIAFEIIDGMLTYNGKPYVWLTVPTGRWQWRITFDRVSVAGAARTLRDFVFPLEPATPEQISDEDYPGVNLAQYSIGTWEPGTVNLTAEAIQQITIMLARASNSAIISEEHAGQVSVDAVIVRESRDEVVERADEVDLDTRAAHLSALAAGTSERNARGHEQKALEYRNNAKDSEGAARESEIQARRAADEFDVTFLPPTTVAPGAPATVTVTSDGATYTVQLGLPKGDKGDAGDPTTPATPASIGSIRLAGNLAGTANAPTVTVPATGGGRQSLDAFVAALLAQLTGKADLVSGKLDPAQLPDLAISEFLGAIGSQAAMLALNGQRGDWAVRTDLGTTWMLTAEPSSALASWREISTPTAPVQSVAGKTGTVTLGKGDVGLGNVDNTSDAAKPISTATAAALDGKASTDHTHTPASLGAVAAAGSALTVWAGTQTAYNTLPAATRNAAGFIAVILP